MKDIQKRELTRAINLINALGCTYKIITPEGEKFGELRVVEPTVRTKRAELRYPYGVLKRYVCDEMKMDLAIGEVYEVKCGQFHAATLRASICAHLTKNWGSKTYTTVAHKDRIEILRTAARAE
jgi:hypothetical protein